MKKFLTIALVALMGVVFSAPAFAIEHEFSGTWYTRGYMQRDFTGEDKTEAWDRTSVYTDTEIGYTALINDNLKFVNLFEFEAEWGGYDGDEKSYGAIGDDGDSDLKIRHSYVDFTLDAFNFKVGAQPAVLARGFLFDDNFAGLVATYNGAANGTGYSVPFYWMKSYEGGQGKDQNDFDVDYYAIAPSFSPSETLTVNPYLLYITSDDAAFVDPAIENLDTFYIGVDVDVKLDAADLWLTAVYQGGDADLSTGGSEDFKAWLAAVGASVDLGAADVHGQVFYATGDDDLADDDIEEFSGPEGQSYLWALVMGHGYGWDDYDYYSANSPGEAIGNIMAVNIGTTVTPMDKLTVDFDIWYAQLAEEDPITKEDELGTEIDIRAAYELFDGLTFEVVAGYLFAGDGTYNGSNDADPYMLGTGLTLEF